MTKTDSRNATKPTSQDAIELLKKREYVHSLRGKFKGKGLLEELMAEKQRERNSNASQAENHRCLIHGRS